MDRDAAVMNSEGFHVKAVYHEGFFFLPHKELKDKKTSRAGMGFHL